MMRMARQVGFEGYDDFREPFCDEIRRGTATFPDRARCLQNMRAKGDMGTLYADMVGSALRNIEDTFSTIDEETQKAAADAIWSSRQVFTLGVGVMSANARNFTYLASTGMAQFHAIPRPGSAAIDDLAWVDGCDVLIAMSYKPYRAEVVNAVNLARKQNTQIIGISDSPASPIFRVADHKFLVAADTPQYFPSSISTIALLETLLSFVIAGVDAGIVERVETFHARRHRLGLHWTDES